MFKNLFVFSTLLLTLSVKAQEGFPVNGVMHPEKSCYVFKNALLHPDTSIGMIAGEMLIRNGKIVDIGKSISIPKDAQVIDLKNQHVYPSFIEMISSYGIPEPKRQAANQSFVSNKDGAYSWNEALKPEQNAVDIFQVKPDEAVKWRNAGFALCNVHSPDGISRGTSTLVFTGNESTHASILKEKTSHILSFNKGLSNNNYPNSLMGSIALLRQCYYDARFYAKQLNKNEKNLSLQAWNQIQQIPQLFIVDDKWDIFRAQKIANEFNVKYIYKGNGDEYQRWQELKASNAQIIIPLKYPQLMDVQDPFDALKINLSDMKHWEIAPYNAILLANNKIPIVFTSNGLSDPSEYLKQIRKLIQAGLSAKIALYAMTEGPANFLQVQQECGSLAKNKYANFIITNDEIEKDKTLIMEHWVKGKRYLIQAAATEIASGKYILRFENYQDTLIIQSNHNQIKTQFTSSDTVNKSIRLQFDGDYVSGKYTRNNSGAVLLQGTKTNSNWSGKLQLENGNWSDFNLSYISESNRIEENNNNTSKIDLNNYTEKITYPFIAYGWKTKPKPKKYLIKNATVWTCESSGKLENIDVLIDNGKIIKIARNISPGDAEIIDGTGKHVSPGIIDEHSHIAISRGVNECSESVTSEVRIGDVIDPEDINIYRQLAGGVTTSHLLHGSCNPVGGQTALIKLRWGSSAEEMKFENADGFIKFALGENVKRSPGNTTSRYPDTRMGVEQVYMDVFSRAKEYDQKIKESSEQNNRRDLRLEAIAEILNKKRFITCHSYVQSEINMLMHVADQFNFSVNTFTHILEGYKVADKMKKHGVGAAGFSDWWAYKYEVYDAIPYNGALLYEQGIITAFNSDDAEMARRLNQEAAKAVKYGNVPEEEALKFVTLNPAKLLHIDNRVGSLKEGKDADLVIWNASPLSIYASPEKTFVDGILYFDKNKDEALRTEIAHERNRLIQRMINDKNMGQEAKPFISQPKRLYHCDSVEGEEDSEHN